MTFDLRVIDRCLILMEPFLAIDLLAFPIIVKRFDLTFLVFYQNNCIILRNVIEKIN